MTEVYDITDFTNGVKSSQLYDEIITNSNITTKLVGIRVHTGNVDIVFQLSISTEEKTELDSIVSAHNPDTNNANANNVNTDYVSNLAVNWSSNIGSYARIATFIFRGDIFTINNVKFVGYMDSNVSSYDVRIINSSNTDILAEQTFSNTAEQVNTIATISNIPISETVLEIHAKKNSGRQIFINNVTFFLSSK